MREKHLFEYAVIRWVPHVERGEFLNVGVIVYCKGQAFVKAMFTLNETRIKAMCQQADLENITAHLNAFEKICMGEASAGPIAVLDPASRFRWLTARRSTIFQASEVHPGLCFDAEQTLIRLHDQLVLI